MRLFEWLIILITEQLIVLMRAHPHPGLFRGHLDSVMPMHDRGRRMPSQADDGDSIGESVNSDAASDSDGSDSGLLTDTSDEDAANNHQ